MAPVNTDQIPARPSNVYQLKPHKGLTGEIIADQHTMAQQRVLHWSIDDVEREVNHRQYDLMEKDSAVFKAKKILITSTLSDDLQLAPGANETHVGEDEYKLYIEIMEFCERVINGLDRPIRETYEQLFGNAIKYGHGVAEIEWDYVEDAPSTKPVDTSTKKVSLFSKVKHFFGIGTQIEAADKGSITEPALPGKKIRLMPKCLKVKPRNSFRFVVDDFMNVMGLVPTRKIMTVLKLDEMADRRKFLVLTLNKLDEDPRGNSTFRPAFNWWNLKNQIPSEMLRFILEEAVPKAVATLPETQYSQPFEYERDPDTGEVITDDNGNPKPITAAESMMNQLKGFHSGSGVVIPPTAKMEPYKKGLTGSNDANLFKIMLKIIDDGIENTILLQTLAQSEGDHQARAASESVAQMLHNLVFWSRWALSMATLIDLFENAVRINFGDWAIRYMPLVSLGDFVNRDWQGDLTALADAYFKGFLDDSQRAELMQWMNLPKPGPSRAEVMAEQTQQGAQQDVNGKPIQPNNNRPDKTPGNEKRNQGNGTEKKNVKQTENTGLGTVHVLGHNPGWLGRVKRNLFTGHR